jgi:GMP synthase-like glutamine amidotransferase
MAAAARGAATSSKPFRGLVVDCEDLPKWDGAEHLFVDRFRKPGDVWDVRRVAKGEKLTADDATGSDAVIITGSHYSPYDGHEWIESMCEWLRAVMTSPDGPRVFASCFGHQVLSYAQGGKVGSNKDGQFWFRVAEIEPRSRVFTGMPWSKGLVGPVHGSERLALRMGGFPTSIGPLTGDFADNEHRDIASRPEFQPLDSKSLASAAGADAAMLPLRLLKSHGDAVLVPPEGALVVASSDAVDYEMLLLPGPLAHAQAPETGPTSAGVSTSPDGLPWSQYRALTVQGHAEFTPREIESKILPVLAERMGPEEVTAFHATKHNACHDWSMLEIAQRFLRRQDE